MQGSRAVSQGDYRQAKSLYAEAVAENPNDATALTGLGRAHLYLHEYEQAETVLRKALQADPDHWEATVYLGLSLAGQGRVEKGYNMIESISVPFKYFMSREIRCTGEYLRERGFETSEAVGKMDWYLEIIRRRQRFRDRASDTDDDATLFPQCPPKLSPYPYY